MIDVSIVIPTKNAGPRFKEVLETILVQKTDFQFEIICIDSGSTDETIRIIRDFPSVKLYEIPPEDFGHGKTRNYGASQGSGEFIVFLTQDALPATYDWLEHLVQAVKKDPLCVGAFGIHYPYEDCNIFDKRDLETHFAGFGSDDTYYWITDCKRYRDDEGYRHLLCFYSDNNSCMRRSIWEKYPYDDVDFAEDQFWARKMIELGYHKAYAAHAPVYHSHNYPLNTYFRRYFDEYKGLYNLHKYCMYESMVHVISGLIRRVYCDFKYVKSLKDRISNGERIYWRFYSIGRNLGRYFGAWFGGHYHQYSPQKQEWMDRHFSQQCRQIKE